MNKNFVSLSIIFLFISLSISGCVEESNQSNTIETIEINGLNVVKTIDEPDSNIKLVVTGVDCIITVTEMTNITEIIIDGAHCVVSVSHNHTFLSEINDVDSNILYYD